MVMTTMRKVLAYGPPVVVSMVLTFVEGAVLPATVGLALFVGGLATMVALRSAPGNRRRSGSCSVPVTSARPRLRRWHPP